MKLTGKMMFMGCEARPSFKNPTKMTYQVAFMQGLDSMRNYIDADDYSKYNALPPFSPVTVDYNYNPITGRLNLIDVLPDSENPVNPAERDKKTA